MWWDNLTQEQQADFIKRRNELRDTLKIKFDARPKFVPTEISPQAQQLLDEGYRWLDNLDNPETPTGYFKPANATSQWLYTSQTNSTPDGQKCLLHFEGDFYRIGIWYADEQVFRSDIAIEKSGRGMVFDQTLIRFAHIFTEKNYDF